MKHTTRFAFVLLALFLPLVASAQFRDLDAAMSSLERGFGAGDVDAIVSGISSDDQVMLQFQGLADKDGFFGRDQAAYLLDGLFNKVKPSGFERVSARGVRAEGQYQITALWTIQVNGKPEMRELYITLKKQGEKWAVTSVRSGGK